MNDNLVCLCLRVSCCASGVMGWRETVHGIVLVSWLSNDISIDWWEKEIDLLALMIISWLMLGDRILWRRRRRRNIVVTRTRLCDRYGLRANRPDETRPHRSTWIGARNLGNIGSDGEHTPCHLRHTMHTVTGAAWLMADRNYFGYISACHGMFRNSVLVSMDSWNPLLLTLKCLMGGRGRSTTRIHANIDPMQINLSSASGHSPHTKNVKWSTLIWRMPPWNDPIIWLQSYNKRDGRSISSINKSTFQYHVFSIAHAAIDVLITDNERGDTASPTFKFIRPLLSCSTARQFLECEPRSTYTAERLWEFSPLPTASRPPRAWCVVRRLETTLGRTITVNCVLLSLRESIKFYPRNAIYLMTSVHAVGAFWGSGENLLSLFKWSMSSCPLWTWLIIQSDVRSRFGFLQWQCVDLI